MDSTARRLILPILATTSCAAVVATALIATPANAEDGTGNYANWTKRSVKVSTDGFPRGDVESSASLNVSSGATVWLPDWTPFGQVYGSSQDEEYLRVAVARSGVTTTKITFDSPAPGGSQWGFSLGDIDAEEVKIKARGKNDQDLSIDRFFKGVYNYCESTPRGSSCGGSSTDVPFWDGDDTLVGAGGDTKGASGWFMPDKEVTELIFKSRSLSGFPEFQVWLATDRQIVPDPGPTPGPDPDPDRSEPVTIAAGKPTGKKPNKKVDLWGTTKKKERNVWVYRATKKRGPAVLVSKTKSQDFVWTAENTRLGSKSKAFFCARVGSKFSDTIRVPAKAKKQKSRSQQPYQRGDLLRCR